MPILLKADHVMRHIRGSFFIIGFFTLFSCGQEDYETNGPAKEPFVRTLSSSDSPDRTKKVTLKEHGWIGETGYTQIVIEFNHTGSGVYAVNGTGLNIKTYWEDNNNIVIETQKSYKGHQKWTQVKSFGEKVNVRYIED